MPVSYAGTVSEHNATAQHRRPVRRQPPRQGAGAWDPAPPSTSTPRSTNDLRRIGPGKAQYTLCCTDSGGVIDDLIAYYVSDDEIFLVPNAANTARRRRGAAGARARGTDHHRRTPLVRRARRAGTQIDRRRRRLGPADRHGLHGICGRRIRRRAGAGVPHRLHRASTATNCCRRGIEAGVVFDALVDAVGSAGGELAGLGARDTLRTEMGYPLHGHELSLDISPLQARLWVGDRAGRRTRSGDATRCWRRRRRVPKRGAARAAGARPRRTAARPHGARRRHARSA